ncbi:ABC transporter substrate-binding protein [Mycobacterium sp. URHB0044]|uniref:ABC transporter substrate-binding protein n=1 Tax=Mycobacterium sp. URHB0044 TaxID=1380386 RepID=UPI0009DFCFD6|nr:ABC transporter substrate-binding protein [Mycobacterium sp. URHB0044]
MAVNDSGTAPRSAAKMGLDFYLDPYRLGVLQDFSVDCDPITDQFDAMRLAFDEAAECGILDRPVELVVRQQEAWPYGQFEPLLNTWRKLVGEENIMGMLGPWVTENMKSFGRYINREEIPTISMCGTLDFDGPWCFDIPNGTFCDEGIIMARWLHSQGVKTVGVIQEDNLLGDEYFKFFRLAARRVGLTIKELRIVDTISTESAVAAHLEAVQRSGAESLAFMGWGTPVGPNILNVMPKMDWDPVKIMSSMFMGTIPGLGYGFTLDMYEGWAGIDQFSENNEVGQAMLDRFEKRYGRRPDHCYTTIGWDIGMAAAEGIGLSKPKDRYGFREGLEQVRMLPAANGGKGTVISFGPNDHRGYKGDYIVVRQVRDGKNILA